MGTKKFKPFDRVLVRLGYGESEWQARFFSHIDSGGYYCLTSGAKVNEENILPYEGNEHLVGTDQNPEEEVRMEKGEWVFASTKSYRIDEDWCFGRFQGITPSDSKIILKGLSWNYVIRFSDFNPNDMEETKKHILCVKNGKIVRYKG